MRILEDINRTRILNTARFLFNNRGYRSVTVDDLAKELGMSKKTIYQYFHGKEEIATAVVEATLKNISKLKDIPALNQSNPLQTLREILMKADHESLRFGPLFLMDMAKYLPALSDSYNRVRDDGKQIIKSLFLAAQELGHIKQDIPIDLLMEIFHEALRALVKPEFLLQHNYSMNDVRDTFVDIFFKGIKA
jgi:AcrR family transcriptional regulator